MHNDETILQVILSASLEVLERAAEHGVPVYARRLAKSSLIVEGPLGKAVAKPALLKPVGEKATPSFGLMDVKTRETIPLGLLDGDRQKVVETLLVNVPTLMSILGILPWQRADVWRYRLENHDKLTLLVEDNCCRVLGLAGRRCLAFYHNKLSGIVAWYNGDIGVFEITGNWLAKWRSWDRDIEKEMMVWLNNALPKLVNL